MEATRVVGLGKGKVAIEELVEIRRVAGGGGLVEKASCATRRLWLRRVRALIRNPLLGCRRGDSAARRRASMLKMPVILPLTQNFDWCADSRSNLCTVNLYVKS
ncbi:hypothetical protein H257_16360 [Aphanomyces astaci]|uniref:Uncharacterized protein n=1 Tax=Aphanomyces astaci TaxID=112090 RepID=W4FLD1_APHAT|nr:hypothetical protein H257_16360 [Aphanomyces astaci]ETV67508.1 hypothetical protein H257_16360 [Aphanomyces astaci]|eukprot:XP_009843067.1 hypothetical protein H257_16360 [Aphanomyces astaci]